MARKKRLNLRRFVDRGRREGALLREVGVPPPGSEGPPREQLEQMLREAEAKVEGRPALWEREYTAMSIRTALRSADDHEDPREVRRRCEAVAAVLDELDAEEFGPLQARLSNGEYTPEDFRRDLAERPPYECDAFAKRLMGVDTIPSARRPLERDMVHYLASHMNVVFELTERVTSEDVFFDLGAGLGLVPLYLAWLGAVPCRAIEYEPVYCEVLSQQARRFNLERLDVINADARDADYTEGTAFYLYDSFRGEILTAVLDKIRIVAQNHPIRFFSRGTCTKVLRACDWLREVEALPSDMVVFHSS